MRPQLLILSFDDISIDPRVIKQVRRFVDEYDVTTCSPGPHPHPGVTAHLELDARHVGQDRSAPVQQLAGPLDRVVNSPQVDGRVFLLQSLDMLDQAQLAFRHRRHR